MRKCLIFLLLAAALATGVCAAADVLQEEAAILGADKLEDALPAEAEEALDGISPLEQGSFTEGFKQVLSGAVARARLSEWRAVSALRRSVRRGCMG